MTCCLELKGADGADIAEEPYLQHEASLRTIPDPAKTRNRIAVGSFIDVRDYPYNARAGTIGTTCDTTGGNATVSNLAEAVFQERDGVCIIGAGALTGFTTPAAPTAALGAGVSAGTTQREYRIIAISHKLGWTAASAAVSIANAPDICGQSSLTTPYKVFTRTTGNIASFSVVPTYLNGYLLTVGIDVLVDQQANPVEDGVYTVTSVNGVTCTLARSSAWANGIGGVPPAALHGGIYIMRGFDAGRIFRVTAFGTIGTDPIAFAETPFVEVRPQIVDVALAIGTNVANLGSVPQSHTIKNGTYSIQVGDLILLPAQTTASENGIYTAGTPSGGNVLLTRATAYDTATELPQGLMVRAASGASGLSIFDPNANGGSLWVLTNVVANVGTDAITFAQQDIRYFAFYARTGGSGNFTFVGAIQANPYWQQLSEPFPVVYRDYGGKMTTSGYGWQSSSHTPVNGRLPSTAPSTEQADYHRARVTSASGNSITLHSAPTQALTGAAIQLDNWQAFEDAMASFGSGSEGARIIAPAGTFQIYGDLNIRKTLSIEGDTKRGGTHLLFGDGYGVRFMRATHSAEGTTSDGAMLRRVSIDVENKSLPQGARYARTNTNYALNRAPWYGAAIHCHAAYVTIEGCSTRSCGSALVVDGRDTSVGLADNCYVYQNDFSSGANGHGIIATGANANACVFRDNDIQLVDGTSILERGFLGNTYDGNSITSAIDFNEYSTVASIFANGYHELSFGTVRLAAGSLYRPLIGGGMLVNPNAHSLMYQFQNLQSPTGFGTPAGLWTVTIGAANPNNPDNSTAYHVVAADYASDASDPTTPINRIDHWLAHRPTVLDGAGALTAYWKETAYFSHKVLGPHAKGSGKLSFGQRGFHWRGSAVSSDKGNLVAPTEAHPTGPGWYQVGDYYFDLKGGELGTAGPEVIGWTPNAEYGVADFAWSSGATVVVGKVVSSGGRAYVVTDIANKAESGALGSTAPADVGSGNSQINGSGTLVQLASATINVQAVAHPSAKIQSYFTGPGVVQVAIDRRIAKVTYTLGADQSVNIRTLGARSGQRITVLRPNNSGDFKFTCVDQFTGTVLAVLPAGTAAQATFQCVESTPNTPSSWELVEGLGIDTRFRREKDRTNLAAVDATQRAQGNFAVLSEDRSLWQFDSSSTASDSTSLTVVTPSAGTGRWLRIDQTIDLKLAIGFGTTDATALWTCPTGMRFAVLNAHWETTTNWTGGTAPAIGLSSSNAEFNTKGDLLGGASGSGSTELRTTLVFGGAVGARIGSPRTVLRAGDTIRFDYVSGADVFTAGAGFAHLRLQRLP